jgi:hypothetical protein
VPGDLAPVYRLARLQEDEGFIDAAEETLLNARHRQPDAVEPNRMLAQFYARLVTALHKQEAQREPQAATNPGDPDDNGVYRVGGSVTPPSRLDVPHFTPEAQGGRDPRCGRCRSRDRPKVTDTRVVQSIPLREPHRSARLSRAE